MSTKPTPSSGTSPGARRGFTLLELLIAVGVACIVLMAILSLMLFAGRSYAALVNYVDLDNFSRSALDKMTSEIREADRLLKADPQAMTFEFSNPDGTSSWTVSYVYDPNMRNLVRIQDHERRVLLEECNFLEFRYFQRNATGHDFDLYAIATHPLVNTEICKAIQVGWICSRDIMQTAVNTESVQSARVVIRKR